LVLLVREIHLPSLRGWEFAGSEFVVRIIGKNNGLEGDETEVPAAAKTGDIFCFRKGEEGLTTRGSNWVPLASLSRRTASS